MKGVTSLFIKFKSAGLVLGLLLPCSLSLSLVRLAEEGDFYRRRDGR